MAKKVQVVLSDNTEQRLRERIFQTMGMKKGNISEAVEEAINVWLDPETVKIVERYRAKAQKGSAKNARRKDQT